MPKLCSILLAAALAAPVHAGVPAVGAADAAAPAAAPSRQRVQFAFHSGFLMNLHHFLYNLATHPDRLAAFRQANTLSTQEGDALQQALAFYHADYAERDLLFDQDLAAIKRALSVDDDDRRDPQDLALPPALAAHLRATAPLYAHTAWPAHDAANRAWIRVASALDAHYGAAVQASIEQGLAAAFPRAPVRVDLVVETGTRQGAYTDLQAVISSGRPSYRGLASLEMLYHETSHVETTEPLETMIAARLQAAGKPADSELWHALQFYTVGRAVALALRRDGIAYQPYADSVGLFKGYWAPFATIIAADWQPWLAGQASEEDAIARLVAKLPPDL